jgi:hypothetical protein
MKHSDSIRKPRHRGKNSHRVFCTLAAFLLGGGLGALSKWMDTIPADGMPAFLADIDIANLFGMVPVWALIALAIAAFSSSPARAGLNAFAYFAGVVLSYWLCSMWIAGFMMDNSYLLVWIVLTLAAFPLGIAVWYARGEGWLSTGISAVILAYYMLSAFSFDASFSYFDLKCGWIGVAFLVIAAAILFVSVKQTVRSVLIAAVLAYLAALSGIYIPYVM